ncbi:hypothetical protein Q8A73_011211 [Channa argus]|nr:hypothetical protein Q8A73_011211 [Channa argus]
MCELRFLSRCYVEIKGRIAVCSLSADRRRPRGCSECDPFMFTSSSKQSLHTDEWSEEKLCSLLEQLTSVRIKPAVTVPAGVKLNPFLCLYVVTPPSRRSADVGPVSFQLIQREES